MKQTSTISCSEEAHRTTYHLVGEVVHQKLFAGSGHYYAFIRSQVDTAQWLYTDDAEVCTVLAQL